MGGTDALIGGETGAGADRVAGAASVGRALPAAALAGRVGDGERSLDPRPDRSDPAGSGRVADEAPVVAGEPVRSGPTATPDGPATPEDGSSPGTATATATTTAITRARTARWLPLRPTGRSASLVPDRALRRSVAITPRRDAPVSVLPVPGYRNAFGDTNVSRTRTADSSRLGSTTRPPRSWMKGSGRGRAEAGTDRSVGPLAPPDVWVDLGSAEPEPPSRPVPARPKTYCTAAVLAIASCYQILRHLLRRLTQGWVLAGCDRSHMKSDDLTGFEGPTWTPVRPSGPNRRWGVRKSGRSDHVEQFALSGRRRQG